MKKLFPGILLLIVILTLQTSCSEPEIRDPELTIDQVVTIDNLILKELKRQEFDVIRTDKRNNEYMVNVKINNMSETMLLDTGSSFTFLKGKAKSKYHLKELIVSVKNKPRLKTSSDDIIENTSAAVSNKFQIGATVLEPWPFVLSDEFETDAILGCDYLYFTSSVFVSNPGVLFVKFNRIPANNIGDILKSNGYSEIDLVMAMDRKYVSIKQQLGNISKTLNSGVFFAPVDINGMSGFCLVDTGASMTFINSSVLDKKFWQIRPELGHYVVDAKGNRTLVEAVTIDKFFIGSVQIGRNTEVRYREVKNKVYANSKNERIPIMGVVGMDILYKQNAIIDFGNHKLYLRK
ncbi:MAG: aspartyl protease family protein [Geobacteraceae bacterium]|nr:aspartyl protease family protein [Geobacteraceae bacterium]